MDDIKSKLEKNIIDSVTDLDESKTISLVKKALRHGIKMSEIAEFMQQGMNNVGELFEKDYIKKRPYTTYGRFSCNIILYIAVLCCILLLHIVRCRLLVA